MIQPIHPEQQFVTSLEKFLNKADKFIKIYYSGTTDENNIIEIMQELQNLVSDTELQQLEIDYNYNCEKKDLMIDYFDSSWY